MTANPIDPVRREIIRSGLQSVPDLVEEDLCRTAYSPLVYEYKDFAVGLVDPEGRIISLAANGLPMFLISLLGAAVRDGVELYGADGFKPGDAIITNHAGTLGQHLNNVVMYSPVFGPSGELRAFMAVVVHWIDIGGHYNGSCVGVDNSSIFSEGLQFRTVKLYDAGQRVEEIFRIIRCNTRLPDMLFGDIDAQYAGVMRGAELFAMLMKRHGEDDVLSAIEIIWEQSAVAARAAVLAIPDGVYAAESFLDNDGIDLDRQIDIGVKVVIEGDTFTVDYSGMGAQVKGPYNCGPNGGAVPSAFMAFRYLFRPDGAANHGDFAPIRIVLPSGTVFSADEGAALGFYQTVIFTALDTILAALAPAMPDRVAAGHHASQGMFSISSVDPETGKARQFIDTVLGGWGGSARGDGVGPFKTLIHGDARDIPVENIEMTNPVIVERYEWRQDSGGPGKFRGGLGIDKTLRITGPCLLSAQFERINCPPWGLFGGGSGQVGGIEVVKADGTHHVASKVSDLPLDSGDLVHIRSSGGGGYGDPKLRDPAHLAEDIRLGYVSRDAAGADYSKGIDALALAS